MLIGIVGKARSGKDTFAEMLAAELFDTIRRKFVLMAYAQELKLRVQRDFDLSYDQLWGDKKEVMDKRYRKSWVNNMIAGRRESSEIENQYWTPREIMQSYGEFYRSIDNEFWVNNLFRVIDEKEYNNVILTDVRHPNEADPVVDRAGYVIKVTSNREDKPDIHGANHISETAMDAYDKIDFHVRNDGTLEELHTITKQVVKFLLDTEQMKQKTED